MKNPLIINNVVQTKKFCKMVAKFSGLPWKEFKRLHTLTKIELFHVAKANVNKLLETED